MKISISGAVIVLSFVMFFLLYGCGESASSVKVSRKGGIHLDSSMVIALGAIVEDKDGDFRKDLRKALRANSDFKFLKEEPGKESMANADFNAIAASLAEKNQSLVVITGKYRASTNDEHKEKTGSDNIKKKYIERTFTGKFSFNVSDLNRNTLSFSRELQASVSEEKDDNWLLNAIVDALITDPHFAEVRGMVIDKFIYELYPHEEVYHVKLLKDKDIPELETGITHANIGQWDKAIELFKGAAEKYPNNEKVHKAYYNLGIAYKWNYKFPEARQSLEKAYLQTKSSDYYDEIQTLGQFEQEYLIRQKEQTQPQN